MNSLKRIAFCLRIQSAGHIGTYIDRHCPIWPELTAVFCEHGVVNYSIFLNRKTLELFGYAEVRSIKQWDAIAQTGACRKWWDYMGDIMVNNDDGTPWSQPLEEVFHHEIPGGDLKMAHWGRYEELRPREIEEIVSRHPVAYIPWGALEYHSYHNPIGLDGIKAHGLCLDLAEAVGGCVLPPVYHATSTIKTHPAANQKSHSIEHSEVVLELLCRELIQQLIAESFKVIVLLTGHCGEPHFSILKRVGRELQGQNPDCWIWVLAEFEVLEPGLLVANHSARGETALQLHYRPDLVKLDRIPDGPAPTLERDGVWGEDPRQATAEEGKAIARAFVQRAAAKIHSHFAAGQPSS